MKTLSRRSNGSVKKIADGAYKLTVTIGYDSKGNQIRRSKTVHVTSDRKAGEELQKFIRECPVTTNAKCPVNASVTSTEPGSLTRATSLRRRSTSMTCSACSLRSLRRSSSRSSSDAASASRGRVPVEVSGGVTLATVRAYAEARHDFIAIGALTHSAPAVDISLEFEPL